MNLKDKKRLMKNAEIILEVCGRARAGETVLILAMREKLLYAAALAKKAVELKLNPLIIDITEYHGNAYKDRIVNLPLKKAIVSADIVLNLQDLAGISRMLGDHKNNDDRWHTGADRKIWINNNAMEKWAITGQKTAGIRTRTLKLIKLLNRSKNVRITSKQGTDISFCLGKGYMATPVLAICPLYGEVAITPAANTARGVFVIDGPTQRGVRPYYELNKKFLKVFVEAGKAVSWSGDAVQVKRLTEFIESGKPRADAIDEIGIPTTEFKDNDRYWWRDKTHHHDRIHIALGNNVLRKKNIHGEHHMDGEVSRATIYVDGKMIMNNGRFTGSF